MAEDLEKMFGDIPKTVLYTRPYQLPVNVAMPILQWELTENKFGKGMSSKVTVKCDEHVSLLIFPGYRYNNYSKEQVDRISADLAKGSKWYLIARRWTALDRVPIDVVSESTRVKQSIPVFNHDDHSIHKVDSSGTLLPDNVNNVVDGHGPSPKKPKRE